MLRAVNTRRRRAASIATQLGAKKAPEKIVMADLAYGTPVKAANADVWMVTKSTFTDFPNLWVGPSLTQLDEDLRRESAAEGLQLGHGGAGALARAPTACRSRACSTSPRTSIPNKKYPMIAYFYEILSDGLHSYVPPTGRNVINPTHYVSNGYLVFEPDIIYEDGLSRDRARCKSIVPGVQTLLERGLRRSRSSSGIQGQSWGGYQTAYLITQTNMFAAAMAGAPVVNMTSAYGGIRWGTGIARAVPVRDRAEPHRRVALGGAAALHRELAALLARPRHDAAASS